MWRKCEGPIRRRLETRPPADEPPYDEPGGRDHEGREGDLPAAGKEGFLEPAGRLQVRLRESREREIERHRETQRQPNVRPEKTRARCRERSQADESAEGGTLMRPPR